MLFGYNMIVYNGAEISPRSGISSQLKALPTLWDLTNAVQQTFKLSWVLTSRVTGNKSLSWHRSGLANQALSNLTATSRGSVLHPVGHPQTLSAGAH